MKKKLLSIVLTFAMVISLMPAMAFAESTTDPPTSNPGSEETTGDNDGENQETTGGDTIEIVAKISDRGFTTLNAAIEAAGDGDTVNIIKDCTIEPVEIRNEITIEGNDHTVTGWDETEYDSWEFALAIDVYSKVTFNNIKFTNFGCGDENTVNEAAVISGWSGCDITITDCSFEKFNRQAIMFAPYSDGNMTVEKCNFDCTPVKPTFTIQKAFVIEPGTLKSDVSIKNCTITCVKSTEEEWTSGGIEVFSGTVLVEDCTFTNCDEGVLVSREYFNNNLGRTDYDVSSNITLKNNTISANNSAVYINCYKGGSTTANVTIESGYYKGVVGIAKGALKKDKSDIASDEDLKKCSISLTGGYYSAELAAAYVAEGYYVDASNISGYPYVVKQGTKPENSTIVVVKDETTPIVPDDASISSEDKAKIESVINKTEVQGVTEAVAGNKDALVTKSGIDTKAVGVDKVNVDVDVKVELIAAEISETKQSMTYTATPIATVTTTKASGEEIEKKVDIEVPNYMLSGEMTVKLPLPEGFEPLQIKHTSSDGTEEYFLTTPERGAKTFTIEDGCAVFKITKFSTFDLSGEVTYVAPKSKSSSSRASSYAITIGDSKNGAVSADCSSSVKGNTITLTAKADEGYTLKTIKVIDAAGTEIKITDKGDGKYSFEMPESKVTVSAEFAEDVKQTSGYSNCPKDATCPINPFTDAENTAWYHDGVHFCVENKLMIGFSDESFCPEKNVTRAQIVTMLWRKDGSPAASGGDFADVSSTAYYAQAVEWAASNNIVNGYSDKKFGPDDSITREQLAAILYRYAKYKGMDVSVGEDTNILDFADATSISSYAVSAIQWACGAGIMNGTDTLKLSPKGLTTRAQAASMMQRFLTENK